MSGNGSLCYFSPETCGNLIPDEMDWLLDTIWREPFKKFIGYTFFREHVTPELFLSWLKRAGYFPEWHTMSINDFRELCAIFHTW